MTYEVCTCLKKECVHVDLSREIQVVAALALHLLWIVPGKVKVYLTANFYKHCVKKRNFALTVDVR